MKIAMIGMPGCGKGTQSHLIEKRYKIPTISTGELIRNSKDDKLKEIISKGMMLDDQVMFDMVSEHMTSKSFILDGFPRTLNQAKMIEIDHAIYIVVDEEVAVQRALNRAGNRSDDTEEIIRDRLKLYHVKTKPMIEYYKEKGLLREIDGSRTKEEVFDLILISLKDKNN